MKCRLCGRPTLGYGVLIVSSYKIYSTYFCGLCYFFRPLTKLVFLSNDGDLLARIGAVIIASLVGILFLCNLTLITSIISALFNPEYWALHRVLSLIR